MDILITAARIALIGFGLYALFFVCGIGAVKLLLPENQREYETVLAPVAGLAVFLILAYTLSFAGFGAKVWIWLVLGIAIAIYAVAGSLREWRVRFSLIEDGIPWFVMVGVFVVGVIPLLRVGYLTNLGTTGDVINYCLPADYLMNHGLRAAASIAATNPAAAIDSVWFSLGARLGSNLVIAGADAFFKLESYQVFFSLICFLSSLTVVSTWYLCRAALRLERPVCIAAVMIIAASNLMYWGSYDGFFAQQLVLGLIPAIIAAGFTLVDNPNWRPAVLTALLISPLVSSYEFSLVYPAGAIGLYFLIRIIKERKIKTYLAPLAISAGSLIVMNALVLIRRGFSLKDSLSSPEFTTALHRSMAGNIRYYTPLSELFGLNIHEHNRSLPAIGLKAWSLFPFTVEVLTVAVVVLIVFGLLKTEEKVRWKLMAVLAPFLAVAAAMRYLTFPYAYYKNIALAVFIAGITVSLGLFALYKHIKRKNLNRNAGYTLTAGAVFLIICFAGLNLYNLGLHEGYLLYKVSQANSEIINPPQSLIALREEIPRVTDHLMIGDDIPDTRQLWLLYFLQQKELSLEKASVYLAARGFHFRGPLVNDFALYSAGYKVGEDVRWSREPVWENEGFVLYQRDPELLAVISGEGGEMKQLNPGETMKIDWHDDKIEANPFRTGQLISAAQTGTLRVWIFSPGTGSLWVEGHGFPWTISIDKGMSTRDLSMAEKAAPVILENTGKIPLIIDKLVLYK